MSIKHILGSIVCISAGLFAGYVGMSIAKHSSQPYADRTIASSPITKLGADQIAREYLKVKIENESIASLQDETSIIKVTITALKDIPAGFQYKWNLASDMTTPDSLTGTLDAMPAGESKELSLHVVGFSKEHRSHINFLVHGDHGAQQLRREVITTSRPEDSFEYVVRQAAMYEQETGKVQKLGTSGKSRSKKFDPAKVIK